MTKLPGLSANDFRAVTMKMLQWVNTNMLETNEETGTHQREARNKESCGDVRTEKQNSQ